MENYFPADVSLRVTGDLQSAQALFPAARQLLFRAVKMKQTGSPVVRLLLPLTDGSLIQVFLVGEHKHVYVQPAVRKGVVLLEEPEVPKVFSPVACPNMLSGVVVPGTGILQLEDDDVTAKLNPDGTDDYAIHEFHPTGTSASVYELNFAWQDVDRLGVPADPDISTAAPMQARWPKPSMYSGAMKRVVQALYGIGKTETTEDSLWDDSREFSPYYAAQNHYDYHWDRTDGIHRVGNDFWLIRISQEDGVLAMPLPLFDCTTGSAFKSALEDIGDVDTFSVIDEFGGLPTGETFPDDHPEAEPPTYARTEAIEAGTVLQLMPPGDMIPFFQDTVNVVDKEAWHNSWGWAFSESGLVQSAHNTCRWYRRADIALEVDAVALAANRAEPPEHRFLSSQHWKVEFNLSGITRSPAPGAPVGEGTATLTLVHDGLMVGDTNLTAYSEANYIPITRHNSIAPFLRLPPNSDSETTVNRTFWGVTSSDGAQYAADNDLICTFFVCFNGEELEEVKHQMGTALTVDVIEDMVQWELFNFYHPGFHSDYQWNGSEWVPMGYSEIIGSVDWSVTEADFLAAGKFTEDRAISGYRSGPFFATSIDLRETAASGAIYEYTNVHSLTPVDVANGIFTGYDTTIHTYYDRWNAETGVAFPAGCREGYVMLRRFDRVTSTADGTGYGTPIVDPIAGRVGTGMAWVGATPVDVGSAIHMSSWYAGVGVIDGPFMPDSQVADAPGTPGSLTGGEWQMQWKQVFNFIWPVIILCGASVNAGPTAAYAMTDGVIPVFNSVDYYFNVTTHDIGYVYDVPGFSLEAGTTTLNTTFVGAV